MRYVYLITGKHQASPDLTKEDTVNSTDTATVQAEIVTALQRGEMWSRDDIEDAVRHAMNIDGVADVTDAEDAEALETTAAIWSALTSREDAWLHRGVRVALHVEATA